MPNLDLEIVIPKAEISHFISFRISQLQGKGKDFDTGVTALQCEMALKKGFQEFLQFVIPLFEGFEEPLKVCLEVQDDLYLDRPAILAAFDLRKTRQRKKYVLTVSGHILLDMVLHQQRMERILGNTTFRAVMFHEVVHLLDWVNLDRLDRMREEDIATHLKTRDPVLHMLPFNPINEIPLEWQLLGVLAGFRNEGLAQMLPWLTGEEIVTPISGTLAVTLFREVFNALKALITIPGDSAAYLEPGDVEKLMGRFKEVSYVIGPWLMLDAIGAGEKEERELAKRGGLRLSGRRAAPWSMEDAFSLLRAGLRLDLGSCLRRIADDTALHPWGRFLTAGELVGIFHSLSTQKTGDEQYPSFLADILDSTARRDPKRFQQCLRAVIGSPMADEEILEAEGKFIKRAKSKSGDLKGVVSKKAADVLKLWKENRENATLRLALTYVFDPEDLIADSIPYGGLLDDLYVLEAAMCLCGRL